MVGFAEQFRLDEGVPPSTDENSETRLKRGLRRASVIGIKKGLSMSKILHPQVVSYNT